MIKQIAEEEIARLQGAFRDLVQNLEMGKNEPLSYLRFWYIENRIKHWSKYVTRKN